MGVADSDSPGWRPPPILRRPSELGGGWPALLAFTEIDGLRFAV